MISKYTHFILFSVLTFQISLSPLRSNTALTCTMKNMVGKQSEHVCESGKSTTVQKIAKEIGAELIVISVADETDYQKIDKLLANAVELAKNKKHVVVLIQNADRMTDGMIKLCIHTFLNNDVQRTNNITAVLTTSDPYKYDEIAEKQYMRWIQFELPNITERKEFIKNYLRIRQRYFLKLKSALSR